jgi:hypothetical protein
MEPMGSCPFCKEEGVDMSHVSDCADRDAKMNAPYSLLRNKCRIIEVTGDSTLTDIPITRVLH